MSKVGSEGFSDFAYQGALSATPEQPLSPQRVGRKAILAVEGPQTVRHVKSFLGSRDKEKFSQWRFAPPTPPTCR